MTPETLRATALHLLATSTNASYTAKQAVRDAQELERQIDNALAERVPPVGAAHGVSEDDDGA